MKKISSLLTALSLSIGTIITAIPNAYSASVQTPLTRYQAEQRAMNMIDLSWTYDSSKNSAIDSSYSASVTLPAQFANVASAQETGIPYDWGGQDGLDSNSISSPWSNFVDAISKGAYAGNVNTTAGSQYVPGTAGIDCSGFVQAVFDIHDYKISTSTMFDKYFSKININDIKHMDILDRPGDHVVIFDKWGTLNGVSGAFTFESTPDQTLGGIQGTKKYFLTMNDINNGYIPGRYINIMDSNTLAVGTAAQISNVTYAANFRDNPSTSANILSTIPKGTIANLIDYNNGWYKLKYNNQVGWVWGNILSSVPSGQYAYVINAYQLNIRTNPSTSSSILGTITQGQYAKVISKSADGNWILININGIQGYSSSKYLANI